MLKEKSFVFHSDKTNWTNPLLDIENVIKKILKSQPKDILVKLVKTVETVEIVETVETAERRLIIILWRLRSLFSL